MKQHIQFNQFIDLAASYDSGDNISGEKFYWKCFGDNAYHYDFLEEGYGLPQISCVVNQEGIIVLATASHFPAEDSDTIGDFAFRWIHPDFKQAMIDEEVANGFDYRVVVDGYYHTDFTCSKAFLDATKILLQSINCPKDRSFLQIAYPIQQEFVTKNSECFTEEEQELIDAYGYYVEDENSLSAADIQEALADMGIEVIYNFCLGEAVATRISDSTSTEDTFEFEKEPSKEPATESIVLDLPSELLNQLFRLAHEADMTFNAYLNQILLEELYRLDASEQAIEEKEPLNETQIKNLVACYYRAVKENDFAKSGDIKHELYKLGATYSWSDDTGNWYWVANGVAV